MVVVGEFTCRHIIIKFKSWDGNRNHFVKAHFLAKFRLMKMSFRSNLSYIQMKKISINLQPLSLLLILLFFTAGTHSVNAQVFTTDYFQESARFSDTIPTPDEFLGYPVGTHYVRYDQVVAYFEKLAELSDRATIQVIGETWQLRKQIVLTLTSPENHANIEEIRQHHVSTLTTGARRSTAPAVVILGYNVHGNESSGTEAALLTAYYLVAETGDETLAWLGNTIVHINPALNPDGRDRAAHWFNTFKSFPPVSDPADLEHNETWPGSRTNHFFHDLNRDWLAITQIETKGRVDHYHQWYPNIQIDFHEMGTNSTYYLEPTQPVRTWNPIIPEYRYEVLSPLIASHQIDALEEIGALYWTKEVFDNISPIYGSTYPDIYGGVGITFEVGSSRGIVQESVHGDVTFASTIRKQVRTGLATLRAAYAEREVLHAYQRDFFSSAVRQASGQPVRAFVFGDKNDRNLTADFLELLLRHRIEVYNLAGNLVRDGKNFSTQHAYIVPAEQPNYRIVHDIFQSNTAFRDSIFYDITGWSIVHGYGIAHVGLMDRNIRTWVGERVETVPVRMGRVIGEESQYAYLFDWRDVNASAALYRLQEDGFLTRTAHREFRARTHGGEVDFAAGTVIIAVSEQNWSANDIHSYLIGLAREFNIDIHGVSTGLSVSGIDLGSRHAVVTNKPEVAIVFGRGVRANEAGETWFHLNKRVGLPVSRIDKDAVPRVDLNRYTTLVLVDGDYGDWSDETVARIKQWVSSGGTLIVQNAAARWAIRNELTPGIEEVKQEPGGRSTGRIDYAEADDRRLSARIPGVILKTDLDVTNPLAFGVQSRDQLFIKNNNLFIQPSSNAYGTVAQYTPEPFVGGHISESNLNRVRNTTAVGVSRIGSGSVIIFAENPNFRSYWHSTSRLFVNAIFHGSSIRLP